MDGKRIIKKEIKSEERFLERIIVGRRRDSNVRRKRFRPRTPLERPKLSPCLGKFVLVDLKGGDDNRWRSEKEENEEECNTVLKDDTYTRDHYCRWQKCPYVRIEKSLLLVNRHGTPSETFGSSLLVGSSEERGEKPTSKLT